MRILKKLIKERKEIQGSIDSLKAGLSNLENLEEFIEFTRTKISSELSFDDKRLALRMLGARIYLDGDDIEIVLKPSFDILNILSA